MANIYIALNGDDVGSRIGEAIANDDHEGLASASSSIEGAHGNIDQWVESAGGKKVTRSGDEGIYIIPEEALADLESIKSSYKEQSGHGLTVGVGSSMSEASKALIYGKLNGKDQVVHYDPMIEDYLSDQDSDEESPEDVQIGDDQDQAAPEGADEEMPEDEDQDEEALDAAQQPAIPPMEGDEDAEMTDEDDSEQIEDPSAEMEGAPPVEGDEDAEAEFPDDTGGDNQVASESPEDASMPMIDEDAEAEEDPSGEDALESQGIDGDIDGEDFGSDKDGSEQEEQSDEMSQAAAGAPMAAPQAPDQQQGQPPQQQVQSEYQELNENDESNPDMDMDNESYEDQPDDALSSMIHGDMNDEDAPQEDQQMDGAQEGESQLDDELRQDIASALMAFKENKDMLEQAREQNPKLYQATITMLRSMIEMAKKLGQNPEQDISDQENEQQLNEEFPAAGEDEGAEMPQEEGAQEEEEMPDMGAMPPGKK